MKIFLTLDYELFMGATAGTAENCLIRPTRKLVEVLDQFGVCATFFVDAAYLYRLKSLSAFNQELKEEFEKVSRQIVWLNEKGHDIELHIHPQWFSAVYNESVWYLSETDYKLSDIEEARAQMLFKESKATLEEIIGRPVIAFRAGGFSLQTFEGFDKVFATSDILVDSSVLSMRKSYSGPQVYDYTNVPPGRTYRFGPSVSLPLESGPFIELPISTCRLHPLYQLLGSLRFHLTGKARRRKYGDGSPISGVVRDKGEIRDKFKQWQMATFDCGGSQSLLDVFRARGNDDVFVVLSHPKNLSPSSLEDLVRFLKVSTRDHSFEVVSSIVASKC